MTRLISRRQVTKGVVAVSGLAASGVIVVGCGRQVDAAPFYQLSAENGDVVANGVVTLGLYTVDGEFRFRELDPTGAITLEMPGQPDVLLARVGAEEYIALASACPHAGCPLGYSKQQDLIECPCHASRFLAHPSAGHPVGTVVHPPAKAGPTVYDVSLAPDGSVLTITLGCIAMNVKINIADHPSLRIVGGTDVIAPPESSCPLALERQDENTLTAISAVCTHAGCTIALDGPTNNWLCPCHGSRFDMQGNVIAGPAARPLAHYKVMFDGTTITISA
jgi:cytochrome b6-f complex iron-sulfur subunit